MPNAEELWDGFAEDFDNEVDHGLRGEARAAWDALLRPLIPNGPARIADLGCGTGSLAVLLAERGHQLSGVDVSGEMLARARAKAESAGVEVDFRKGDAAVPPLSTMSFDVVLARHVLWLFDDPDAVLKEWLRLLAPNGRLILIEGRWSTGVGLDSNACRSLVLRHRESADLRDLGREASLWGRVVDDERFLVYSPK